MALEALNHQATSAPPYRRWLTWGSAAIFGLAGVAAWGMWQYQADQAREALPPVSVTPEIATVTALGHVEPEGDLINLVAPTATQENRIEQLLVHAGDVVEAGQVIAILDNRNRLQAALQKAEEQVAIAQAQLAQVKAGAKTSEFQAQQAEIDRLQAEREGTLQAQRATAARLEAEVQNARIESERYESLYQQGAISASERDARQLTYTTTQRQLQETQAQIARIETTSQQQLQQAQANLTQLSEVRPVDVEVATAELQSARASVAEAQADLDQAYVRSPMAGQIIEIHTRPGEKIAEEGVATLGQTQQMMAIAEVYQNDIGQVELGQSATITSPALTQPLQGTVERIGLQVGRQQVVNEDPAVNLDARVIEVYVRLDPAASAQVAGLSNLQVTVTIQTP
jgi:HlyD family secretion protein